MSKELKMRADNKGLTIKVNLFSLEKDIEDGFTSQHARLWIKGCATHATTKEEVHFNDAGELISILGKWNSVKFKELKATKKNQSANQNVA